MHVEIAPVMRVGKLVLMCVLLLIVYRGADGGSCTGEHLLHSNPWAMQAIAHSKGVDYGQCGRDAPPDIPLISRLDMGALRTTVVVTANWLKEQLASASRKLCVIDSSWSFSESGHEEYLQKHIPGAVFFDLDRCIVPTQHIPRNLPEPRCLEEYSKLLGITKDCHIVVYDRGSMMAAARAWWQYRLYGHPNVSVLEGGMRKWEKDKNEVHSGGSIPKEVGDFEVKINKTLLATFEDVINDCESSGLQILDARSPSDFKGIKHEPSSATKMACEKAKLKVPWDMSRGHIPGAINVPTSPIVDPDTGLFNTPEEIEEYFHKVGVALDKPVTTMCYNGNLACVLALGMTLIGKEDASVYYGSWTEYGQRVKQSQCVVDSGRGSG